MRRWILPILLLFLLTSCRLPSIVPQVPRGDQAPGMMAPWSGMVLTGRIERSPELLANFDTFKIDATVALVDSRTGLTLGTSLTDDKGQFVLSFGEAFAPVAGQAYYLDLLKGIQIDEKGPFNQAGADALRLRNVLIYHASGGWQSLMNREPANFIQIGNQSTALSIALGLKQQAGELVDLAAFMGALDGGVYPAEGLGTLDKQTFEALAEEVRTAIAKDADPLQYVVYDQNTGKFIGSLVQFSITDVYREDSLASDPTRRIVRINDRMIITGTGFDTWLVARPVVKINGQVATIVDDAIRPDVMTVKVAAGSRSGPVTVTIDGKIQAGPSITIAFRDGHSAIIGDKLYVSNPEWHTVVEIALRTAGDRSYVEGDVKTLWSKTQIPTLDSPRQIAIREGKLYVACYNSNRILRLDPNFPGMLDPVAFSASVTRPYGLAFDPFTEGDLYVTSHQTAGAVVKLNAAGALVETFSDLVSPRAIAVDFDNNLFVSQNDGQIMKLARPDTMNQRALTSHATIGGPEGLAIDSSGDIFVASKTGGAIYRISRDGPVSVFATLNQPAGLMLDDSGNFYVSDEAKNQIVRFSPSGAVKIIAYGISAPRGIAVDPSDGETLYVSLSTSNAILKIENDILKPFVTGIANPMTLNFQGDGLLVAHPETGTVSFARRNGMLETLATGLVYPGGAVRKNANSPLYVARFGDGIDASRTERLPKYPWLRIGRGSYSGFDIVQNGQSSWQKFLHHQRIRYLSRDSRGNIFMIDANVPSDWTPMPEPNDNHPSHRSLVMLRHEVDKPNANDARPLRMLYGPALPDPNHRFGAYPGHVTVDRYDNVYVSVPDEGVIYRFAKDRGDQGYRPEKISGLGKPWGMAFSDTTPQVLYVSDQSGNRILRVTSPEDEDTRGPDPGFSVPIPALTTDLGYRSLGDGGAVLYGIYRTTSGSTTTYRLFSCDVNDGAVAAYQPYLSDLRSGVELIYVHPTTGDLYLATSNAVDRVQVASSPPIVDTITTPQDGSWAITYDGPTFSQLRAHTYDYGVHTVGAINTTREVDLFGDYLYVASPDTGSGSTSEPLDSIAASGGVLRVNLVTGEELYVPIRAYGLGVVDKGGGDHEVYIGSANKGIFKLDANGKRSQVWTAGEVGQRTYALDVHGPHANPVIWAVADNGQIFRGLPASPATRDWRKYGMHKPVF